MKIKNLLTASVATLAATASLGAAAADWSNTEVHIAKGTLLDSADRDRDAVVLTLQHASGWKYGDNFFFIDHTDYDKDEDGTESDSEFYGEWYTHFSFGKITGKDLSFGPIKDIGLVAGINWAPDVDSYWTLPGVRVGLDLPGFAFAQVDIVSYDHHYTGNSGDVIANGYTDFHILDEDSSFMVDFAWKYPFEIGGTKWSIEGHAEYIGSRDQRNTFGEVELNHHILAQPQIRFDLGHSLWGQEHQLYIGIEYQYWKNKLGNHEVDESEAHLQAIWVL